MQALMTDEIIEEIHGIRHKHASCFDFNVQRIIADLKKSEQLHTEQGWRLLQAQQKSVSKPMFQRIRFSHFANEATV
jgi:coproporphyrinogen III oxidase-like Fe-S oxidoreductase